MLSLFSGTSTSHRKIIVDVGSGSAASALVEMTPEGGSRVLYEHRVPFMLAEALNFKRYLSSMRSSLDEAISGVLRHERGLNKKIFRTPVHLVVNAPWYLARTKLLSESSQKSFVVSERYLAGKLETAAAEVAKEAQAAGTPSRRPRVIEHEILSVRLNGYRTARPYGKRVRRLEVALYESVIGEDTYDDLFDTLTRHTHSLKGIHTFMYLCANTLKQLFPEESNYLIANVESELTEISLVRDGTLIEHISFPLGVHTLLRSTAKRLGTIPQAARSHLAHIAHEHGEGAKRSGGALEDVRGEMLQALGGACSTLSRTATLPSRVFLVVEKDYAPWFRKIFSHETCTRYTALGDPFAVMTLTPALLRERGARTAGTSDIRLAIECHALGLPKWH